MLIIIISLCLIAFDKSDTKVTSADADIKLPIIMYHGFTDGNSASTYVLKISDFENDLKYLKENGFSFILVSDLINLKAYGTPLPEKPVMLTFDDGYLNNYTLAYPLLKKYSAKAVISPIMYFSEVDSQNHERNAAYSNLNFNEIKEMAASGLVEIQNHSYNLHSINNQRKGSGKSSTETSDEYRKLFFDDTQKAHSLIKEIVGTSPLAYAYPFGFISEESKSVLTCMGYRIAFGCTEGTNYLSNQWDYLKILKRFNRTPEKSVKLLLKNY